MLRTLARPTRPHQDRAALRIKFALAGHVDADENDIQLTHSTQLTHSGQRNREMTVVYPLIVDSRIRVNSGDGTMFTVTTDKD